MKKYYLLLLLFFGFSVFSQKKYSFDYLIQYENQDSIDAKKEIIYLLTNSKDNTYCVDISEIDADRLQLILMDLSGLRSVSIVNKKGFYKTPFIELPCEAMTFQNEHIKLDRYVFKINPDTLIGGKEYQNYSMWLKNTRDSRKYKIGKSYYIIEEGTEFHAPLGLFGRSFDVFYANNKMPNGIAKEMYNISKFGKKIVYKLIDYKKFDRTLFFPEDCVAKWR